MLDFAKNVADFAASIGKKHVVILSSLDSGIRKRVHASRYMESEKYVYTYKFMCTCIMMMSPQWHWD